MPQNPINNKVKNCFKFSLTNGVLLKARKPSKTRLAIKNLMVADNKGGVFCDTKRAVTKVAPQIIEAAICFR